MKLSEVQQRESEIRVAFQQQIQHLKAALYVAHQQLRAARAGLSDRPEVIARMEAVRNPMDPEHRRTEIAAPVDAAALPGFTSDPADDSLIGLA